MEPFQWIEKQQQPSYFELSTWMEIDSELQAGFSSRLGGVSQAFQGGLNCALHVGDQQEYVMENRKRLADCAGFDVDAWTCAEQVHDNNVFVVKAEHKGAGLRSRDSAIQHSDALVTNVPGVVLTSFYADCVPLYFFDPVRRVIGLAHAGWKGTVLEIGVRTVEKMQQEFGSQPHEIRAAIGPSIGGCCYEVDDRVAGPMRKLWNEKIGDSSSGIGELDDLPFRSIPGKDTTMLNLQHINRQLLLKAGIQQAHIEKTQLCTSCNTDQFFSHRKEKGKTGRMVSWIGLKR